MEPETRTLEVLREIREEGKKTCARLDELHQGTGARINETNARLTETNARIDQLREELSRRIVESGMRTATAITALAGTVAELVTFLRADRELKSRLPDA